jgi:iron complex transport system permease protein
MILWVLFFVNDDCSNVPWVSNISSDITSTLSAAEDPWGYLLASYSLCIYSFVGCMLIAGLVLATMAFSKKGSTSGLMIIITGQVFGGIIGSITGMVRYYMTEVDGYEAKLELMNATQIGSFYRDYTWIDVVAIGVPAAICVVAVLLLRQRMMALSLGNEEARTLGVDSKRTQLIIVAASTLLTAILVSFAGRIGFVGFLIPHLARRFVGPNFKYLLPASSTAWANFRPPNLSMISRTLSHSTVFSLAQDTMSQI